MHADAKGSISPQMLVGVFITVLGALLLLDNLNLFNASDVLRFWPAAIIALGLMVFVQATDLNGQVNGFALTVFGAFLLLNRFGVIQVDFWRQLFWPSLLIFVGLNLVLQTMRRGGTSDSVTDTVSLFAVWGGTRRTSNARAFRGADMTAIMGGCELDLRQASMEPGESATIHMLAVMGGCNIWVPEDWAVVTHVIPFMGGVVDKRMAAKPGASKTLVLRGMVLMGGLEIRN
jgi:predicted membrane protein